MKPWLVLAAIILTAALVRSYRLTAPLADWHSWRQADTAAVTRRYVAQGINLLHPRYDDLSSIPSGRDNPQGYRMVEFPFVNAITAWLYQLVSPPVEIHVFSRLISIAFSLGSLIFLYLLTHQLTNRLTATLAAAIFALLPYNIYYSRTILPEVPLVFFSLGAMYFFVTQKLWPSAIFASAAMLLKPYAIFLGLPLIFWAVRRFSFKDTPFSKRSILFIILYLAIAFIPLLLWRAWISQFPEGIPAFTWLLNGNGIRFKGAWFRWLFADRLSRLILGYFGLIPFTLGVIQKPVAKSGWFFHAWLLGILAYLAVFATGNVQHDYYQIITIPIISIFVAKGIAFLLNPPTSFSKITSYVLLATCSAFALAFGWYHVRDYFNINHPEIIAAGQAADQLLPPDAKVIAPYKGDTAFLYQTNRRGWPIGDNIEDKIKLGATHYVTTTLDDEAKILSDTYQIIKQTDSFVIIDLTIP